MVRCSLIWTSSKLTRFLICACISVHVVFCKKNVTIHSDGGGHEWKVSAEHWPCLEKRFREHEVTFNNYGCYLRQYIQQSPPLYGQIVWSIPQGDGPGPIRLATSPDMCLDAGRAHAYLERNGTPFLARRIDSMLDRIITLQTCNGNMSQQFFVDDKRGIINLALRPEWHLNVEYSLLVADSRNK
eukprot:TRINITY_DN20637_c0_g1_i4.p1 TRINITY_DN20637_c0_g1~~TRINITY_DN20637_c0_g1_i4.p1  ORF type:complete len:185 (+),score=2.96 TRINITY_DN20637_c0_g1_i4:139-693(+)